MTQSTAGLIKAIHMGKRRLGMDNETYREMLRNLTGLGLLLADDGPGTQVRPAPHAAGRVLPRPKGGPFPPDAEVPRPVAAAA